MLPKRHSSNKKEFLEIKNMLAKQKIQQKDWQKAEKTSQKGKGRRTGRDQKKEKKKQWREDEKNQMINPTSE